MQRFTSRLPFALMLIALATATRLLPHQANFTAMGAVALVSGCYLGWRTAAGVTVAAMLVSDIFLGFYSGPIMLSVYGSLLISAGLGYILGRTRRVRFTPAAAATLAGTLLFFLATNFAVWQFTAMYPKTISGLLACYIAALPFLRNSLAADFLYTGVLLGVTETLRYGVLAAVSKKVWRPIWRMISGCRSPYPRTGR
ncbi:MAG: hypothetical protein PHI63_06400 [Patescibacteria group bacterium]|nr:hypothetical protein [Patescibacteria group bacterium]